MILGGLDSPRGRWSAGSSSASRSALTAGYQQDLASGWAPASNAVMPYLVMIVILLVRPYGLFGTQEVRRV